MVPGARVALLPCCSVEEREPALSCLRVPESAGQVQSGSQGSSHSLRESHTSQNLLEVLQ